MANQKLQLFLNKLNSELVNSKLDLIPFFREVIERMAINMEYEDQKSHDQLRDELEFVISYKDHKCIEKFYNTSEMSYFIMTKGYFSNLGRGSQASSMICYSLRITKINPSKFNLDWTRFLNIHSEVIMDLDIASSINEDFHQYLRTKFSNRLYYAGSESKTKITRALKTILEGKEYQFSFSKIQELITEVEQQILFNYLDISSIEADELKESVEFLSLLKEKSKKFIELFQNHSDLYEKIEVMISEPRWRGKHPSRFFITNKDLSNEIYEYDKNSIPVLNANASNHLNRMEYETYHVLRVGVLEDINESLKEKGMDSNVNEYLNYNDSRVFRLMNNSPKELKNIFQLASLDRFKALYPEFIFNSIESISDYSTLMRRGDNFIVDYKDGGDHPPRYKELLSDTYGHLIYQEQLLCILKMHNLDPMKYFKLMAKNRIRYHEVQDYMTEDEFLFLYENAPKCMVKSHTMAYAHYTYLDIFFKYIL